MPGWTSAALIAVLGIGTLTQMAFAAGPGTRFVAALVPPWAPGGLAVVQGAGLGLVDMHWGGHVVIVDTGGDAAALQGRGYWLLDATGVLGCGEEGTVK
jgi:hypothetical protein